MSDQAPGIVGVWTVDIATPIGTMTVMMEFSQSSGVLEGIARGRGEVVALQRIAVAPTQGGERVTWSQAITKPMRLNLEFDVTVTGGALAGTAKAGRLPKSTVRGRRRVDA